jgi:phage terminase Nu1 subunit (DNA packaging protein)
MKATKAAKFITDTVDAAVLGRVLGISRASIANLATDGVLPRADRGLFNLPACVQAYIRHKLLQAGAADLGTKSLVTERSRLAKLKADRAEREDKVETGELISAGEIESAWLSIANTVRTRILLVPRKIAPRVVTGTVVEAESLMQRELNAALAEIAATPV